MPDTSQRVVRLDVREARILKLEHQLNLFNAFVRDLDRQILELQGRYWDLFDHEERLAANLKKTYDELRVEKQDKCLLEIEKDTLEKYRIVAEATVSLLEKTIFDLKADKARLNADVNNLVTESRTLDRALFEALEKHKKLEEDSTTKIEALENWLNEANLTVERIKLLLNEANRAAILRENALQAAQSQLSESEYKVKKLIDQVRATNFFAFFLFLGGSAGGAAITFLSLTGGL